MDKRGRPGFVEFTLEIPIEIAEHLIKHSQEIVRELTQVVKRYHQNPPVSSSKTEKSAEEIVCDRQNDLKIIGRVGYRLFRRRLNTDGYFTVSGTIQKRTQELSQLKWRSLVIKDIADELSVSFFEAELSIRKFRSDLQKKIKPRRAQAIIRLYLNGSSNAEIAERLSVSTTFVSNFLKDNKEHIRNLFKALPESHKPLKRNKRGKLPGKPLSVAKKHPETPSGKQSGESN